MITEAVLERDQPRVKYPTVPVMQRDLADVIMGRGGIKKDYSTTWVV